MLFPAVSVKQPWADKIASGVKTIETRTWITAYRGPLAICSSRLPKGYGVTGKALCIVFLKHCRVMQLGDERLACCPIYERAQAWLFGPRRIGLIPFDVRGALGLYSIDIPQRAWGHPDDQDLAAKWLGWARDNGMMEKLSPRRR